MSTEEINSVSVRDTLSEDTLQIIQNLANKTQKLPALWKQVYHIAGRTHFLATGISAEWEEGAKIEYYAGETIDFSKLHVYLHKDDEYTLENENQIEETSAYVPSITVVPDGVEIGELSITINYGSGSEVLSTIINVTVKEPYVLPVDIGYYEGYGYGHTLNDYLDDYKSDEYIYATLNNGKQLQSSNLIFLDDTLPSVDSDQEISALIEFDTESGVKEYEVPFTVHYHSIYRKGIGHDSSYATDSFIKLLPKGETEISVSISKDNSSYWFLNVMYDDSKSTTIHGGSFDFRESLPVGRHTKEVTVTFPGGLQETTEMYITVYKHSDITLKGLYPYRQYQFMLGDREVYGSHSGDSFHLYWYNGDSQETSDNMMMPPIKVSYAYGDSSRQRDAITNEDVVVGPLTDVERYTDTNILIRKNSDNTLYYYYYYTVQAETSLYQIDNHSNTFSVSSDDLNNMRAADDGSTYTLNGEEYTIVSSVVEGYINLYEVHSISEEDYRAWAEEIDITVEL